MKNTLIKLKNWFYLVSKFFLSFIIYQIQNNTRIVFITFRLIIVLVVILGGAFFITKKLTPPDYTIHFKRECDEVKCEKVKIIDSERNTSIENEIETLSSTLNRFDFFARFTFLRFNLQTTNRSQFVFVVTEPKFEKGIDITMQCNFDGKDYIFSPNSGIIFQEKSTIGSIIQKLNKIQDILINCNPAPQKASLEPLGTFVVAPNAQIQFIYNEEKYHLRFLPDKWNYLLTALQIFIITGIVLGAYYELKRFLERGFK